MSEIDLAHNLQTHQKRPMGHLLTLVAMVLLLIFQLGVLVLVVWAVDASERYECERDMDRIAQASPTPLEGVLIASRTPSAPFFVAEVDFAFRDFPTSVPVPPAMKFVRSFSRISASEYRLIQPYSAAWDTVSGLLISLPFMAFGMVFFLLPWHKHFPSVLANHVMRLRGWGDFIVGSRWVNVMDALCLWGFFLGIMFGAAIGVLLDGGDQEISSDKSIDLWIDNGAQAQYDLLFSWSEPEGQVPVRHATIDGRCLKQFAVPVSDLRVIVADGSTTVRDVILRLEPRRGLYVFDLFDLNSYVVDTRFYR